MRSPITSFIFGAVALTGTVLMVAPHAFAEDDLDSEITITHKKLGPLSEWAKMQADKARYESLKARFDPTESGPPGAAAAAERNAALPPSQREPDFFSEVRNAPTPPVIKAAEDAITGDQ